MKLLNALFINRAPFERISLNFNDNNVFLLVGVNGKGKTTFLSYIVDSFYELAKKSFYNEFEGKTNKYYRLVSGMNAVNQNEPSIVYLRYMHEGRIYDYIDAMGDLNTDLYNKLIPYSNKIHFNSIESSLKERNSVKHWSVSNHKDIEKLFDSGIYTFFPSYRFEIPNYLNDPFKKDLQFKLTPDFSGDLKNPIEVSSCFNKIANWIMDIVLDNYVYQGRNNASIVRIQLNDVLTKILANKVGCPVRFGIGPRQVSSQRISVMDAKRNIQLYPNIFAMSSGEVALLCLFAELIKQADIVNHTCHDIEGIVLIDEVDKHLHITLQKDVLPSLIVMFPHLQFIVTSHSPFFSMGLAETIPDFITYDFDNNGLECPPLNNRVFKEAYDVLIAENIRFAEKYNALLGAAKNSDKPLLITEGKTDWKHLKAAMHSLNIDDLDIDFFEFEDTMGCDELFNILTHYSRIGSTRKVIGIFDRDNDTINSSIGVDNIFKNMGNGVFAFCIPPANVNEYGPKTCIEHYYKKKDLTKEDESGRRLFLGQEFYESSGNSVDGKYSTKASNYKNKIKNNGIIDDKVFLKTDLKEEKSVALSKETFANLVFSHNSYSDGFDFSEFNKIFDVIRLILNEE